MKPTEERLIVKFNGGRGAILCSNCRVIIKEGHEFSPEELAYIRGELDYLPPQICNQCVIKFAKTPQNV